MSDEKLEELVALELPYRRKAKLSLAEFDSGMKMARLVLREGMRITQVDLDREAATALGQAMLDAAAKLD